MKAIQTVSLLDLHGEEVIDIKKQMISTFSILTVAALLLTGCSLTGEDRSSPQAKAVKMEEEIEHIKGNVVEESSKKENVKVEEEKKTIEVIASEYTFSPEEISIKKGQTVKIIFKNEGSIFHDWVIKEIPVTKKLSHEHDSEYAENHHEHNHQHESKEGHENHNHGDHVALHISAEPGQTNTMEFVADKSGTYSFYCSVPGHIEGGMTGSMKVE